MMYPCLEIRFIIFVAYITKVEYWHKVHIGYIVYNVGMGRFGCLGRPDYLFGVKFILRTHEISLHKNNSPGSPDKDTPLTGSCYKNANTITWMVVINNHVRE